MTYPFRGDVTAHRKACGAVRLLALHYAIAPGHWHVVNHPLLHVVLMDTLIQELHFTLLCLLTASIVPPTQQLALVYRLPKVYLKYNRLNQGKGTVGVSYIIARCS